MARWQYVFFLGIQEPETARVHPTEAKQAESNLPIERHRVNLIKNTFAIRIIIINPTI